MGRILRTLSFPDLKTYNEFKKIVGREGSDVSKKVWEFIDQYVKIHGHGNPQIVLDSYVYPGPPTEVCPDFRRDLCAANPRVCVLRKRYVCPPWSKLDV